MDNFEGRVAVITGAGSGLGREFARLAAKARMRLVLADVQHDPLQETVRELQSGGAPVIAEVVDVASSRQVAQLADRAFGEYGSKIPYGGFSPVRLQTGFQPRPSLNMLSLSARPALPRSSPPYTRLKSLSPKRAFFRRGTFVQAELPRSSIDYPVPRSLAPQWVMLSHRIIAYYYLIRASRPLPLVYGLSSGSLPYGLVWAGSEKVPNLSRSSFPIVPSSVPRRLGDCLWLLLHRPLWPFPSSHKVGARLSTLGRFLRGSCNEAAKFALCYGPIKLLALLRQGRLLSSFHLLGHPWGVSNITTRVNNQFPRPDFHRLDKQPYRLHAKVTKLRSLKISMPETFVVFVCFVVKKEGLTAPNSIPNDQ